MQTTAGKDNSTGREIHWDRLVWNGAVELDSYLILSKFQPLTEKLIAVHAHESAGALTHRVQFARSTFFLRLCAHPDCDETQVLDRYLAMTTSGVNSSRMILTTDHSPRVIGNSYEAMLIDCGELDNVPSDIAALLGRLELSEHKPLSGEEVDLSVLPQQLELLVSGSKTLMNAAVKTVAESSLQRQLQYALATPPFLMLSKRGIVLAEPSGFLVLPRHCCGALMAYAFGSEPARIAQLASCYAESCKDQVPLDKFAHLAAVAAAALAVRFSQKTSFANPYIRSLAQLACNVVGTQKALNEELSSL